MSGDIHHDGGRLGRGSVTHRHVVEHDDGSVSAIIIRAVPALVCDVCEDVLNEPHVTDAILRLLERTEVGRGRAVAVDYSSADAA